MSSFRTLHHDNFAGLYPLAAKFDAGWSSPVARQAHNLKVIGSNPIPAPKTIARQVPDPAGFVVLGLGKPECSRPWTIAQSHLADGA
jgi:hypothetical protein